MKEFPVTRISVNPQTMNQKTLDVIGRKHTVEDTVNIFHMARELEFDNINMDLIIGLPGRGKRRSRTYAAGGRKTASGQPDDSFPGTETGDETEPVQG